MGDKVVDNIKQTLKYEDVIQFLEKLEIDESSSKDIQNLVAHTEVALELMASNEIEISQKQSLFGVLVKSASTLRKIDGATAAKFGINTQEQQRLAYSIEALNFIAMQLSKVTEDGVNLIGTNEDEELENAKKCVKHLGNSEVNDLLKQVMLNLETPNGIMRKIFLMNPSQVEIEVKVSEEGKATKKVPLHEWAYLTQNDKTLVLDAMEFYEEVEKEEVSGAHQDNYDIYIQFICANGIKIKPQAINPLLLTEVSIPLLLKHKILNEDQIMGMVKYNVLTFEGLLSPYKDSTVFEVFCSQINEKTGHEVVEALLQDIVKLIGEGERKRIKPQCITLMEIALKNNLLESTEIGVLLESQLIDINDIRSFVSKGLLNHEILSNIDLTLIEMFIKEGMQVGEQSLASWLDEQIIDQSKPVRKYSVEEIKILSEQHQELGTKDSFEKFEDARTQGMQSVTRYRDIEVRVLLSAYQENKTEEALKKLTTALRKGIEKDIAENRENSTILNSIKIDDFTLFRKLISETLTPKQFKEVYGKLDSSVFVTILNGRIPIGGKHPLIALAGTTVGSLENEALIELITECMMHTVDAQGKPVPDGISIEGGATTLLEYVHSKGLKISYEKNGTVEEKTMAEFIIDAFSVLNANLLEEIEEAQDKQERRDLQYERDDIMENVAKIASIESISNEYLIGSINANNAEIISQILVERIEQNATQVEDIFISIMSAYSAAQKSERALLKETHNKCKEAILEEGAEVNKRDSKILLDFISYCARNPKVSRYLTRRSMEPQYATAPINPEPQPGLAKEMEVTVDGKSSVREEVIGIYGGNAPDIPLQERSNIEIETQAKTALLLLELDDLEKSLGKDIAEFDKFLDSGNEKQREKEVPDKFKDKLRRALSKERMREICDAIARIFRKIICHEGPVATKALEDIQEQVFSSSVDTEQDTNAPPQNTQETAALLAEMIQNNSTLIKGMVKEVLLEIEQERAQEQQHKDAAAPIL